MFNLFTLRVSHILYFKFFIKKLLSPLKKRINASIFIHNYSKNKYVKRALLIYMLPPRGKIISHGNYYEFKGIVSSLDRLGFSVDVTSVDYSFDIDAQKYDVIVGFGAALDNLLIKNRVINAKVFLYATSQHFYVLNSMAMKALKRFEKSRGFSNLDLVRYRRESWQPTFDLVDGIVCVGGAYSKATYLKYSIVDESSIVNVFPPYIEIYDQALVASNFTKVNYMWFAGDGPVHKGLDLLLDIFSKDDSINLYVIANLDKHSDFLSSYHSELFETSNISYLGFLDVKSERFKDIAMQCDFVCLPSCSEGFPNSLTTVVGNFGCIPIVTKYTSFDVPNLIRINELDVDGVRDAIELSKISKLSLDEKKVNRDFVRNNYNKTRYENDLYDFFYKNI